jgi:hypothetical protein
MRRGFPDPTTGLAPQDAYYAQRPVTP